MQSWGTRSRFRERDTEREPTKSGIVGMLCAAMGLARGADLSPFRRLEMGVRVDREGVLRTEFQTAERVATASGKISKDPQISWRQYLADAAFLVALGGEESLLTQLLAAWRAPHWPLYLGRKGYVPAISLHHRAKLVEAPSLEEALLQVPLETTAKAEYARSEVRMVVPDDGSSGETRADEPIDFSTGRREYAERPVRTVFVDRDRFGSPAKEVG